MTATNAEQAARHLEKHLKSEGATAVSHRPSPPAPEGFEVVLADAVEGGYPGQSLAAVVLFDGHAYGSGLGSFAELLDAAADAGRGLSADETLQLLTWAHFGGNLIVDTAVAPTFGDGKLEFAARDSMSGKRGHFVWRRSDQRVVGIEQAPAATPITAGVGLQRALDGGDFSDIMAALAAIPIPATRDALPAVARACVHPSEVISGDAIDRIGESAEAAAALRSVLAGQPSAVRADVLELVDALIGEAFVLLVTAEPSS
ncbi:MAG: hypothetical protein ACI9OJ_003147 [Myxococcota bacterium]|jgi:hypothetical protein